MREINQIIVHCAATRPSIDIGATEIRQWHLARGWSDIGYHYVIKRSGYLETGRDLERSGAHAKGHNSHSIGVCMVGGVDERNKPDANFTYAQYASLKTLLDDLTRKFPNAEIIGHRDLSTKACPSFDPKAFIS